EMTLDHVAIREDDVAINDLVAVYVDGSRQQPLIDDAGRRANDAGIDARPVLAATATAALDHEVQRSRTTAGIGNRAVGTDAPVRLDPGSILRIVASVCSVDEHQLLAVEAERVMGRMKYGTLDPIFGGTGRASGHGGDRRDRPPFTDDVVRSSADVLNGNGGGHVANARRHVDVDRVAQLA